VDHADYLRGTFVRPGDLRRAQQFATTLRAFARDRCSLPGIRARENRDTFLEQLIESIRRIEYIAVIQTRHISPLRADPSRDLFDPLKAAIVRRCQGQIDEAFWLVFLSVYFGKNRRTGWRLARDVYSGLGSGHRWDWARTAADPHRFRQWLGEHQDRLRGSDGIVRSFGNHRKYERLDAWSPRGTGAAVESYVAWVGPHASHLTHLQEAQRQVGTDPRRLFDYLYLSMTVGSFGRTAKFDYLTMVGKIGLAPIAPGSTYMQGATGPFTGARLLFGGATTSNLTRAVLEVRLVELDAVLNVGMQVLEDALCNWQKSPNRFRPFRG
jgi:hypothetical protein